MRFLSTTTLKAAADTRELEALLVPFDVECKSNLGRFTVPRAAFSIPTVPAQVQINIEHDSGEAFGHATELTETDEGVIAKFSVFETPEGDAALADIRSGKRRSLSVEAKNVKVEDGKAVSGRIYAAALVEKPAFPGARLLASLDETAGDDTAVTEDDDADLDDTDTETETDDADLDETKTKVEQLDDETDTADEAAAANLAASRVKTMRKHTPQRPKDTPKGNSMNLEKFLATASAFHQSGLRDETLKAALADVVQADFNGANVPEFIGELWAGRGFTRRVIPLLSNRPLTKADSRGWKWVQKPTVAAYNGGKATIPTPAKPNIEQVPFGIARWASGYDIDRKFYDFNETEVLGAFYRELTTDYSRKTEQYAIDELVKAATVSQVGTVAPTIGVAQTALVDGALRVLEAEAVPTFALVSLDLWRQLALTPKDNVLALLTLSMGLEEGDLAGFKIIPEGRLGNGSVLVGAGQAAGFDELPGTPIRVNALDIGRAGVDEALYGYGRMRVEYPEALQLVTQAAVPAPAGN